jgi:ribosomal protein S18 acetylase RimI-like enzyme
VPWETRNLERASYALTPFFIEQPNEKMLLEELTRARQQGALFVQGRFPQNEIGLMQLLQRHGFYWVESTLCPFSNLNKNTSLQAFRADASQFLPRFYHSQELSFFRVSKTDAPLQEAVRKLAYASFSNDRFHHDPYCSEDMANQRFAFWISDLWADNDTISHVLARKEVPIGFVVSKDSDLILGGFAHGAGRGLGNYLFLAALDDLSRSGISYVQTLVSTHNIASLNWHARLGFQFRAPAVTMHFWGD